MFVVILSIIIIALLMILLDIATVVVIDIVIVIGYIALKTFKTIIQTNINKKQ